MLDVKKATEAELIGELLLRQMNKMKDRTDEIPRKPENLDVTDGEWKSLWDNQPISLLKIIIMPETGDVRHPINPQNALIDVMIADGSCFAGTLPNHNPMVLRELLQIYFGKPDKETTLET